jgi:hypothetical protein
MAQGLTQVHAAISDSMPVVEAALLFGSDMKNKIFGKRPHDVDSPAKLRELMTAPPMSAQQHRDVMHGRVLRRRAIEDLKARKALLASDEW